MGREDEGRIKVSKCEMDRRGRANLVRSNVCNIFRHLDEIQQVIVYKLCLSICRSSSNILPWPFSVAIDKGVLPLLLTFSVSAQAESKSRTTSGGM